MFKKIYDLKVKDVEDFIKTEIIKDYYNGKLDDNLYLRIIWCPSDKEFGDTFYVNTQPIMESGKDQSWQYYKGKKISYEEYQKIVACHWHIDMREVYSLMTGETTLLNLEECEEYTRYEIAFQKEIKIVIANSKEWYIQKWKDDIEIKEEVPKEIMEYIKKNEW